MASNYGIIAYIKAPILREVTQPALIQFETAYAAYKERCIDVNRTRGSDEQMAIESIRDCVESSTLHALCIMGEIENASTVEQATTEKVQKWFEESLAAAPKDLSERIESALRSVSYSICEQDPAGAATTFVINVIKALDQDNASSILNDKDKAKIMIKTLEDKLEPPLLRERVKMRRSLWNTVEKSDIKFFRKEVAALAVDVSQNEIARSRMYVSGKRFRSDHTRKPGKPHKTRRLENDRKEGIRQHSGKEGSSSSQKRTPAKEWTENCLNPKCDGIHRVKNCPMTSPEECKQLLDQYFKTRKVTNAIKKAQVTAKQTDDGRYRVMIEEKTNAIALGDYGADRSALPHTLFNELIKADPALSVTVLENPLSLNGAFNVEADYTAAKSIVLSITIYLPGSNVPVRIRGVTFYVVDEEMDEVLLGRPFLKAIGFNLDEHLQRVRTHVHDKSLSEIDQSQLRLAAAKYYGLSYQDPDDDPIPLPEAISAGIGKDSKESIDEAFRTIPKNAKDNGISEEGHQRLADILERNRNAFRIKLGPDPPANVPPLVITPAKNAQTFRSPQRRYARQQRDFIIQTIRELESVGAIYKNPAARWASPALAVPKPGSTKLRFTVDLRGPNSQTVPIQSAMPNLESKFQDISGSTCFADIDLAHGYWQVPLSKESQEFMSIQTPIGVYSSRRLLQGGSDSENNFQAVLQKKFEDRVGKLIKCLDDFLFYANDEAELLDNLESFLTVCLEVGIKVHAEKSYSFNKKVQFCGRLVSADRIQYHPRHYDAILNMKKPNSADELQQLLCATNWMRNSIPAYAELIRPLHSLMEMVYSDTGKRKKLAERNIPLANSWGAEHDISFENIKKQLAASVKLAHPKADHDLCLFTDASDSHWAAILTQVPTTQRRKEIEDEDHAPLCFLSGAFTGSSANWNVPEKE